MFRNGGFGMKLQTDGAGLVGALNGFNHIHARGAGGAHTAQGCALDAEDGLVMPRRTAFKCHRGAVRRVGLPAARRQ